MKSLLSLLFICLSTLVYSQFDKISYEIYYQDDGTVPGYPEGYTTYRLYAELMAPGDQLFSLLAIPGCSQIQFSCNNDIWNNDLAGISGQSINEAFYSIDPSLEYDSYITNGVSNSQEGANTFLQLIGTGYETSFGNGIGSDFSMQDGIWFDLPPDINIYPVGPEHRVLIAQITTSNPLSWELSVQVRNAGSFVGAITYEPIVCTDYNHVVDTDSDLIGSASIPGCMDGLALNYNSFAQIENGSCIYGNAENTSCMNSSTIIVDAGPELYSNFGGDNSSTSGTCWEDETTDNGFWVDFNSPGESAIISMVNIQGILSLAVYDACGGNEIACADGLHNYDFVQLSGLQSNADYYILFDSSSPGGQTIELLSGSGGCLIPEASNYNEDSLFSDGSCFYGGCTDVEACNYDDDATGDDGSCEYPDGCTDYSAENYDPAATCDDGSCVYAGCTDPDYGTYNPNATIDDGSCEYILWIMVFQDFEENGVMDYGTDEFLGNIAVTNSQTGFTIISDPFEQPMLYTFPEGTYDFEVALPSPDWYVTTDISNIEIQDNEGSLHVGLSTLSPQSTFIYPTEAWTANSNFYCGTMLYIPMTFQNIGNIDATYTLEIISDPLLYYEINTGAEFTIVEPGHYLFSDIPLTPGASHYGNIGIESPYDWNDPIDIEFSVTIEDLNSNILVEESWTRTAEVFCDGFFPNLTSNLMGLGDEAYILPEDDLMYTVQVENTTGATAEDIEVTTVLSPNVDWMTFISLGSTSQATISISQNEEIITYLFSDINLEDGDELLLFYQVSPKAGLLGGEEIYNIATARFDGGAPVPTNPTLHTIFNCDWIDVASDLSYAVCEGEEVQVDLSSDFIESFAWTLNDETVGDNSNSINLMLETGDHNIGVLTSNPICERNASIPVVVNPLPVAEFTAEGAELTAAAGNSWQWYFEGEAIDGATEQTYLAETSGLYTVEIENEFNCSALSDESLVTIVGISEQSEFSFIAYPNPTFNTLNISFSNYNENREVEMIDSRGRTVIAKTTASGQLTEIDLSNLSSGNYILQVFVKGKQVNASAIQKH